MWQNFFPHLKTQLKMKACSNDLCNQRLNFIIISLVEMFDGFVQRKYSCQEIRNNA